MTELLPKTHRILEKGPMEFRPFGEDRTGEPIRDVSGLTVRANVEHLEDLIARKYGHEASQRRLHQLVERLNSYIPDRAYQVTLTFLKNPWNSYSYEFLMYLTELCAELSGEPDFQTSLGREKYLSPVIQVLGRPFSLIQIYKLYPYFVDKFTKGALKPEVISVTDGEAVMRLALTEKTAVQFGRYRRRCAEQICQATKATIAEVPSRMFGLAPASVEDRRCMADGDDYCEWRVQWTPQRTRLWWWWITGLGAGGLCLLLLQTLSSSLPLGVQLGLAAVFPVLASLLGTLWADRKAMQEQAGVIQEQLRSVETQHEELRRAYLQQEQTTVELRRKISELTVFHQIGLRLNATLDRHEVIQACLNALIHDLGYNCALLSFFDPVRCLAHGTVLAGASEELTDLARSLEIPIKGSESFESQILVQGQPCMVEEMATVREIVHPRLQEFLRQLGARAFLAVPLRFQQTILGMMVAVRTQFGSVTAEDLSVLGTLGNQLALALHNAEIYAEIQRLNRELEAKVKERTFELEHANQQLKTTNQQLQEMNRVKSRFLSHCSHELRTPLASIKGFTDNLLAGLAGPLTDKQQIYLARITANADRLTRMISDLLDLTRIEAGKIPLSWAVVDLSALARDVAEQFHPLMDTKGQRLLVHCLDDPCLLQGDADRLTQVLTNLVHNASKFTPEGGTITIQVNRRTPEVAMMSVTDTGPGIAEDVLPQIFDPFFQAESEQEVGTKGLGLGLAIAKQLVELHHGMIAVESRIGEGTTFCVTLPTAQPNESAFPSAPPRSP
ncbi:MAG: GAF domain-containing protein [Nitrospirae bacterium]|nr:MAG: GAF domain-containing protein [Nitrospirota bacterium]